MKVALLFLIVSAAVLIIICGVWVTIALIAELWPRKTTTPSVSQTERTPAKAE